MVKRSKKSKSKRVPLRKKYKIIRKVKEHHKKKAKEAKKLGFNKKPKVEKDPGIPNDWPFKEQELKALEERRQRAVQELEEKKAARKERAKKRKLELLQDGKVEEEVEKENDQTEEKVAEIPTVTVRHNDHSERAFYKELVKVIDASDVIIEVLDARDPLGTRSLDMEEMVLKSGYDKRLVLLLNKIDLVPRESVEKWLKYLREELPTVAFKSSTQEQKHNLGWKSGKVTGKASKSNNLLQTSDCLGAETLIKLLKNYSRSHEIKKSITVGVIGLPNVGKSSIINSLKRSHVANVGATPGLTRSLQEIHLDKNVKLLDCPGVVMLKSSNTDSTIALRNCKRVEKLEDPVSPVSEILKLCPEQVLVSLYKIPTFESVDDFLLKVATVRGRLKKGGVLDVDAVARIVLHDWNAGKITYYTMPPVRETSLPSGSEARIVSKFSKEFDVDEVYGSETTFIGSLKSVNDFNPVEVPPSSPLKIDLMALENDEPSQPQPAPEPEHSMECDEDDAAAPATREKNSNRKQNEKLYAMEGMLNPKQRKANKKRMKKENRSTMYGDYDFNTDFVRSEDSAMAAADDDNENPAQEDSSPNNRFQLPSGVDLD